MVEGLPPAVRTGSKVTGRPVNDAAARHIPAGAEVIHRVIHNGWFGVVYSTYPQPGGAGPVRHIPQAAAPPTQATYPSDHPHHIPPCQVPLFYATYPHVVRTSRRHIPRLLAPCDISQLTRGHPAAKVGGARWGVGRGRSVLRSVWLVLRSTPRQTSQNEKTVHLF